MNVQLREKCAQDKLVYLCGHKLKLVIAQCSYHYGTTLRCGYPTSRSVMKTDATCPDCYTIDSSYDSRQVARETHTQRDPALLAPQPTQTWLHDTSQLEYLSAQMNYGLCDPSSNQGPAYLYQSFQADGHSRKEAEDQVLPVQVPFTNVFSMASSGDAGHPHLAQNIGTWPLDPMLNAAEDPQLYASEST